MYRKKKRSKTWKFRQGKIYGKALISKEKQVRIRTEMYPGMELTGYEKEKYEKPRGR